MKDMESTVEVTTPDSAPVDAAQDQETVETTNTLEEILMADEATEHEADATEAEEAIETHAEQSSDTSVSKGIKGRIQAAEAKADRLGYERGRNEAMQELEAYKASISERIRELEEYELEKEAKKLADQEHISIGIAKRLIRAEKGLASHAKTPESPVRDDKGRFAVKQDETDVKARAETLMKQAEHIKNAYGADVLETFKNDKEIQKKVGSGEWDMKDVYIHMISKPKPERTEPVKSVPAPIRGGGGAQQIARTDIAGLSDKAFEKLQEKLRKGAVYRFDK